MSQCSRSGSLDVEVIETATTVRPTVVEEQLKNSHFQLVEKANAKSGANAKVPRHIRELFQKKNFNKSRTMPFVACKMCLKVFKFTSHETGNTHLKDLFKHVINHLGLPSTTNTVFEQCFSTDVGDKFLQ